jgi:protease-4
MNLVGSYTLAETLKQIREDPLVSSVVLRIESPGGSSMASDVIWREVALTAKVKPVVVSMGGVAASGGYYVAVPGKTIYATPFTVTGSIGIFYGKADVAELLKKVGVKVDVIRSAPRADAESIYRPFTEDEISELKKKVKQFYDVFVDRVAQHRPLDAHEVDAVARGRVWMGRRAFQHRLVDKIGGLRQAVEEARILGELPDDAPIVQLPPPNFSLLALAAKMAHADGSSQSESLQAAIPKEVGRMLRTVAPFVVYSPDQPLALCEVSEAP